MSALFDLQTADLTLSREEVSQITGVTGPRWAKGAIDWLKANRWHHHTNRAGEPIVGRLYATLKLSGI